MLIAFNIILLILMFCAASVAMGAQKEIGQRASAVFLASLIALTVTLIFA